MTPKTLKLQIGLYESILFQEQTERNPGIAETVSGRVKLMTQKISIITHLFSGKLQEN